MIEPFGPEYNVNGLALAKHRRMACEGVTSLSHEQRQEYGAAVERAVKAAQRAEIMRALPAAKRPNCASGSWDEFPGEAVRRQQHAALLACPAQIRKARTPEQWQAMYAAAMAACGKLPSDEAQAIAA